MEEVSDETEAGGLLECESSSSRQSSSRDIKRLLTRPVGRPPKKSIVFYHHFNC